MAKAQLQPQTAESVEPWKQAMIEELAALQWPDGEDLLHDPRPANAPVMWWELAVLITRVAKRTGARVVKK